MSDVHTGSACRVYLITTMVPFPHHQLVKFPGDVLGSTGVGIPVGVNAVDVGDEVGCLLLLMIIIIAMPARSCATSMELIADLALWVITFLLLLLLWLGTRPLLLVATATRR